VFVFNVVSWLSHLHLFMCLSDMLIGVVGGGWLEIFAGRLFGSMVLWVGSGDVICCGGCSRVLVSIIRVFGCCVVQCCLMLVRCCYIICVMHVVMICTMYVVCMCLMLCVRLRALVPIYVPIWLLCCSMVL